MSESTLGAAIIAICAIGVYKTFVKMWRVFARNVRHKFDIDLSAESNQDGILCPYPQYDYNEEKARVVWDTEATLSALHVDVQKVLVQQQKILEKMNGTFREGNTDDT